MYASAMPSRLNQPFGSTITSADAELTNSLRNLRARSRQLVRDAAFAKNAKRVITNNVIGTGIHLQCAVKNTRGGLNERLNDAIEGAWETWAAAGSCHTGGQLAFHDIERLAMGQVFEAGEIILRKHYAPFGDSKVPLALEVIESERLLDGYAVPGQVLEAGAQFRMGVEMDRFCRPLAYWVRDMHLGDIRFPVGYPERAERVPAEDIYHLRIIDRWPQSRGEPWMHAVARKLNDMDGYSEAEIVAARGGAQYMGTIETTDDLESFGERQEDGTVQIPTEPGMWLRLSPGEKATFVSPNRPNSGLDPFMRFMLREVAAGTGISYESLSRDYSQTTYSSGRLALLDDRDVWRALQQWFIRTLRRRLHRDWLRAAVMARAIPEIDVTAYALDPAKFEEALFRPRGWQWIDPTKEVAAFKDAVKAGFMTVGQVIAQTAGGEDVEDVMTQRASELEYFDELNLAFDTSPTVYVPAETRGQMVVGPDGSVEPAKAPAAPGTSGAPPAEPEPAQAAKVTDPDAADEPAEAEGEDEDRARLHVVRLGARRQQRS
jgi:lambda family phage portal protein